MFTKGIPQQTIEAIQAKLHAMINAHERLTGNKPYMISLSLGEIVFEGVKVTFFSSQTTVVCTADKENVLYHHEVVT